MNVTRSTTHELTGLVTATPRDGEYWAVTGVIIDRYVCPAGQARIVIQPVRGVPCDLPETDVTLSVAEPQYRRHAPSRPQDHFGHTDPNCNCA